MGHTDSSGRPNGRVLPSSVSHLSAFWACWLMSGMNKIMGKIKSKSALGNSAKEERKPIKDKFNGLRFPSGKNGKG